MKTLITLLVTLLLFLGFATTDSLAQTDGVARFQATISDYSPSGTRHWTVVWVTTSAGKFIKTLWKQGPSITDNHWNDHCPTWWGAKAGSTALDGYSSATAQNYTGTNSPVILTWNGRDTNNVIMADGEYKFWIQYAENSSVPGPVTSSGLLWTKAAGGATKTYSNQSTNFTAMKVTWTPVAAPPVAPIITSAAPTAAGTVGVAYSFTCTATGTAPINFSATSLPPGLAISTAGVISGTPTTAGTYSGTITAANGTLPNATQPFTIVISAPTVAPTITSAAPTATGTVGSPYNFTCTATGTAPINFSATSLPPGLAISTAGVISGTPTTAGTYSGTITAANGTLPNANQAFSIVVGTVPLNITSVQLTGSQLTLSGTGPANGSYAVLSSTSMDQPLAQWSQVTTGTFNASGAFSYTTTTDAGTPQRYYVIRLP